MQETDAVANLDVFAAAHGLQRQVVGLQCLRDGVVHHHLQHTRLLRTRTAAPLDSYRFSLRLLCTLLLPDSCVRQPCHATPKGLLG